jgi:uncharacterized protein HemY
MSEPYAGMIVVLIIIGFGFALVLTMLSVGALFRRWRDRRRDERDRAAIASRYR